MSSVRDRPAGDILRMATAVILGMSVVGGIGAAMYIQLWDQCKCDKADKPVSIALFNFNQEGMWVVVITSFTIALVCAGVLLMYNFGGRDASQSSSSK